MKTKTNKRKKTMKMSTLTKTKKMTTPLKTQMTLIIQPSLLMTQSKRPKYSIKSTSYLNSSRISRHKNGWRDPPADKSKNPKKKQPTLKATMTTISGMISTSLTEINRSRKRLHSSSAILRSTLAIQRLINLKKRDHHGFVFILQEALALRELTANFIIECPRMRTWKERMKITWEMCLEGQDMPLIRKTIVGLGHLIRNVELC